MTLVIHKDKELFSRLARRFQIVCRAVIAGSEQDAYKVVHFLSSLAPSPEVVRRSFAAWLLIHVFDRQGRFGRTQAIRAQGQWDVRGNARIREILAGNHLVVVPSVPAPEVSIIVVLHNNAHLSVLSIESVLQFADVSYELIVVDNGSTDGTCRLLDRVRGARILRNPVNAGFGPACVQGAAAAMGEFLCFLNNDALLTEGALSAGLRAFESAQVGAVGGKILLACGKLQEAGSIVWADGSVLQYGRGDDPGLSQYNFRRPVDYCSGVFLITPRAVFRRLGGFKDEFAPGYYEDTDYCMTLWDNGLSVIYEPSARILHYESATSGGHELTATLMEAHRVKFVSKWKTVLARHYPPDDSNVAVASVAARSRGL